jgi:hypothetical protein
MKHQVLVADQLERGAAPGLGADCFVLQVVSGERSTWRAAEPAAAAGWVSGCARAAGVATELSVFFAARGVSERPDFTAAFTEATGVGNLAALCTVRALRGG